MIIGVIGLGTVGYGVVDILTKESKRLSKKIGQEVVVKYGCAMEERELPESVIFTYNYQDVLQDPEVDVVVELIGGTTIAKKIIEMHGFQMDFIQQLDEKKIPQIAGYTKEFVIQIADDSYDSSLTA